MEEIQLSSYKLTNLERINIILGKNGCGKSTVLKNLASELKNRDKNSLVNYFSPERGGILAYDPGVEVQMQEKQWDNVRNQNQASQFKLQTVVRFRTWKAEIHNHLDSFTLAKKIEGNSITPQELEGKNFTDYLEKINFLLDNIEIVVEKNSFKIIDKSTKETINPSNISSGESELITLGIECLAFSAECKIENRNYLLLDEPDVHIHPDLQAKLMIFLKDLIEENNIFVFIATHSTALLGALENYDKVAFNFLTSQTSDLVFEKINSEYKALLPIFGAHPLSSVYCATPIFLVEGEDDVWIWQKAIRNSGKLKIFPCETNGNANMNKYEKKISEILNAVYDKTSKAYSLVDRDDSKESSTSRMVFPNVQRFMLSCRCAENLLLCDETLKLANTTWQELQTEIIELINHTNSNKYLVLKEFRESGFNRKDFKNIKAITNIICGIISTKPWQVLVGQAIGDFVKADPLTIPHDNESLASYLGKDLAEFLNKGFRSD